MNEASLSDVDGLGGVVGGSKGSSSAVVLPFPLSDRLSDWIFGTLLWMSCGSSL